MNRRLLWILVASLALAAAPAATDSEQGSPAATRLALVGGMLLDGHDAPPIHHAAILIEGDRIVRAGPSRDVTIPAGTRIIDTSGRTMMPGMIELHAHLVLLGHGDYGRWFPWMETAGPRAHAAAGDGDCREATADGRGHLRGGSGRAAGGEPHHPRPHREGRRTRSTDVDERPVADAQRRHLPRGLSRSR